jgi:hypothetical protein
MDMTGRPSILFSGERASRRCGDGGQRDDNDERNAHAERESCGGKTSDAGVENEVVLLRSPGDLAPRENVSGKQLRLALLDASGRRRWCAMEVCGSRAKMRRLYARRRSG